MKLDKDKFGNFREVKIPHAGNDDLVALRLSTNDSREVAKYLSQQIMPFTNRERNRKEMSDIKISKQMLDAFYSKAEVLRTGAIRNINDALVAAIGASDDIVTLKAENERLRVALNRIANGPWPKGIETAEDQCVFDYNVAISAINGGDHE